MPHYNGTVITRRPIDEVFDYLADFSSVAEWDPSIPRARRLDSGEVEKGSRFEVIFRILGREQRLVYRVLEITRPRHVRLRAETDGVTSTDTIELEAIRGGGTRIGYNADLGLKGRLRLAELPMRLFFRWIGDRGRRGLEEALA